MVRLERDTTRGHFSGSGCNQDLLVKVTRLWRLLTFGKQVAGFFRLAGPCWAPRIPASLRASIRLLSRTPMSIICICGVGCISLFSFRHTTDTVLHGFSLFLIRQHIFRSLHLQLDVPNSPLSKLPRDRIWGNYSASTSHFTQAWLSTSYCILSDMLSRRRPTVLNEFLYAQYGQ